MKGFWKRAAMGLLAIAMLLCAACAAPEQEPEQEMQTDIAGADWRTYGQVSDAGTITRAGEQTSVLACVFDSGVEFYLDEETQTFFAEAVFPEKIEGAHDLFEALSLDDLNGDGDSDVQLMSDSCIFFRTISQGLEFSFDLCFRHFVSRRVKGKQIGVCFFYSLSNHLF